MSYSRDTMFPQLIGSLEELALTRPRGKLQGPKRGSVPRGHPQRQEGTGQRPRHEG